LTTDVVLSYNGKMRIILKIIALCLLVFVALGVGYRADRAVVRSETAATILDHIRKQQAAEDPMSAQAPYPELDPAEIKRRVAEKRRLPWAIVGTVTVGLGAFIICWNPKRVI
jgi:hypothetical protein